MVTRRRPDDNSERGDAGLPLLLITPALLFIVLHLVSASQQLAERREAFSVASAAARLGNQPTAVEVRRTEGASLDQAESVAMIEDFVTSQGFDVVAISFDDDRGDGSVTVTVEVAREVDYIFPHSGVLNSTVVGEASAVVNRGVSGVGT
ncbi:MAG: hypothetical protein AAF467_17605 [Actinomycetota bacterium]